MENEILEILKTTTGISSSGIRRRLSQPIKKEKFSTILQSLLQKEKIKEKEGVYYLYTQLPYQMYINTESEIDNIILGLVKNYPGLSDREIWSGLSNTSKRISFVKTRKIVKGLIQNKKIRPVKIGGVKCLFWNSANAC